jgi:DNA-binding response OmpR family regulator
MKKPAKRETGQSRVTALAVAPIDEDLFDLKDLFRSQECVLRTRSEWHLEASPSLELALPILRNNRIPIVLCESGLPDGTWKDLLNQLGNSNDAPLLIVTSRHADERLWAEALNLGAWDVLSKPFDNSEVIRVVDYAWHHWRGDSGVSRPKSATWVA